MAYNYKVLSLKVPYDRDDGLKVDPRSAQFASEMEAAINSYTRQGWRVVSTVPLLQGIWGKGGNPAFNVTESILVVLEMG